MQLNETIKNEFLFIWLNNLGDDKTQVYFNSKIESDFLIGS